MKLGAPGGGKEELTSDPSLLASSLHSFTSPDGNIYTFLEDGHLEIVSPAGSVEREVDLRPPADGLTVVHMAAAGPGFLFMSYDHIANGEQGENLLYRMITVVYPQTGEVTASYRMPQIEPDLLVSACATSTKDFFFLSADDQGFLKVVRYSPN